MGFSAFRESRVSLKANTPQRYSPSDTSPNFFMIVNNGQGVVYLSVSPNVSPATFEVVCPALGSRKYGRPDPIPEVWLYSTQDTEIYIASNEQKFDASMVTETQEIAAVAASGMLGKVNVGEIIAALPTGSNTIGNVGIVGAISAALSGELPAGTNKIGGVDVITLPTLPAGTNNIGDVDVVTLPAIPTGTNVIGKIAPIRNNITLKTSAAQTASGTGSDTDTTAGRSMFVMINVSAVSGTSPTLVVSIKAKDVISGNYFLIDQTTSITAAGQYVIKIPNCVADTCRAEWTIGGTTPSFTFSIGASLMN